MNSIKCPECGLVNFATASECKRCHMSFVSEQESYDAQYDNAQYHGYCPQNQEPEKTPRVFSGGVVFLTGILVLGIVILVLQQGFHAFGPELGNTLGFGLALIGIALLVVTHIWLLIRIFEQSIGWGLASLFLPIVGLVAIFQFWEKTKRSFVGQFVSVAIMCVGFGIAARP